MQTQQRSRNPLRFLAPALCVAALLAPSLVSAQTPRQTVTSGRRYKRLVIRNATVVDGNGTPASGPKDIVVEGDRIAEVVALDPVAVKSGEAKRPQADAEIDATGKYVLPGLINAHGHIQEERGGVPQPLEYELKLWLACGITTVRDVSSDTPRTLQLRQQSADGTLAAPRLFVYAVLQYPPVPRTGEEMRARVRELKRMGV
ncbi:MAG TPA: hypothetical protein VGV38_11235, partial [Pyrinomonadaceae bacterium]|nr:hypothetical protein [Pyrinomonadaceae bacterium]